MYHEQKDKKWNKRIEKENFEGNTKSISHLFEDYVGYNNGFGHMNNARGFIFINITTMTMAMTMSMGNSIPLDTFSQFIVVFEH